MAFGGISGALGIAFFALLAGLVGVSSWVDIKQRRIPNWLSLVTLLAGLLFCAAKLGWPGVGFAGLHVFVALIVGMAVNATGAIGAGDAKLYAAMAAWLPIQSGIALLVSVAIAGLVLLVGFTMARRGRIARTSASQSDFDKLPFGVAIACGGLLAVALS